ncbi:MAG: BatA domain-containing protein [Planctomycetes bacterium]|nr:BatA domain-containing protein [Planctomycetota bacterium]
MIEFTRPWALVGLFVPVLVVLLTALASRARSMPTATLEVWREIDARVARSARRRARVPLALWLLALAMVSTVLALAEPRSRSTELAPWRVVLDRSPSMYLGQGSERRIDVALRGVREVVGDGEVEWVTSSAGFELRARAREVPAGWLAAPRGAWSEPRWASYDEPGTLWLTDVPPESAPSRASLLTSGATPCAGLVARGVDHDIVWDGSELRREPHEAGRGPRVAIEPALLAGAIGRAALVWAQARGWNVTEAREAVDLALVLGSVADPQIRDTLCAAEGWSMPVRVKRAFDAPSEPRAVLLESDGRPLAVASSGLVELAFEELGEPQGDPTSFALFWARAFDAAALPPEGTAVAERARAGPARRVVGEAPPRALSDGELPWSALLGVCAALAATAALAVRR